MNSVQIAVGCSKGEPGLYDQSYVSRLYSDRGKGPALNEIIQRCLTKILNRPFQERNARHVVGAFDCEEGHVKLHRGGERGSGNVPCGRGDVYLMDASGPEKADAQQESKQVISLSHYRRTERGVSLLRSWGRIENVQVAERARGLITVGAFCRACIRIHHSLIGSSSQRILLLDREILS